MTLDNLDAMKDDQEDALEQFVEQLGKHEDLAEEKRPDQDALFAMYREEVRSIPPLAKEEETRLLKQLLSGQEEERKKAAGRLTEGKLSRAVELAEENKDRGLPLGDLVQEAGVGLMTACAEYQGEEDFDQMADRYMMQRIEAALLVQKNEKTVAEDMRARVNVLKDISQAMAKELGREATVEELAQKMKMTVDEIEDIMKETLNAMSVTSAEGMLS